MHAGLGIVEAIATTLNPRLARDKGVQLAVRVGIHTGPVVVGAMGGDGRRENLATGETVNIAARLEGLAAPNTVVISQATSRLVHDTFALEALGPTRLKGVAEPMPVYRVRGLAEADEAEPRPMSAPFVVGRGEEVGLLRRLWEQCKEGLGHAVLVSGTAGIGKSTVVELLRAHVREEGRPRIVFRCSPYHQNIALYPLVTHIETLLQVGRGEPSEVKLQKLAEVLGRSGLPLEETVPLFAALLSLPLPEGRYPALDLSPEQLRQRTFDTIVAWLLAEAERHPVLTAWEDLHWADPSTLEVLGLVLEQTPTVPMLHVLTFRPEFEEPWPRRSHMTPITLNRLERPQVEALITHRAGGKALPAEVVSHIVAKTDGVPLYVEELTKMLLDSSLLRAEGDRYLLTGPLSAVSIPDTLQDSLMARLDQLRAAKEVAQLGAVLGREFAYDVPAGHRADGRGRLAGRAAQAGGGGAALPAGPPAAGPLPLQARSDPGRRLRVAPAQRPPAGPRQRRAGPDGEAPRAGGDPARAARSPLHASRSPRASPGSLAGGGRARGAPLRLRGGDSLHRPGPGPARPASRGRGARPARAGRFRR